MSNLAKSTITYNFYDLIFLNKNKNTTVTVRDTCFYTCFIYTTMTAADRPFSIKWLLKF